MTIEKIEDGSDGDRNNAKKIAAAAASRPVGAFLDDVRRRTAAVTLGHEITATESMDGANGNIDRVIKTSIRPAFAVPFSLHCSFVCF